MLKKFKLFTTDKGERERNSANISESPQLEKSFEKCMIQIPIEAARMDVSRWRVNIFSA